jgi:hypothetical protein
MAAKLKIEKRGDEILIVHCCFSAGTIPARFGLIWFSGFKGEDLNVIFYQNMPNLHNQHKSAERKISQKNLEYMSLKLLGQFEPNFGGMVLGWPPSKMCPVIPTSNQDGCQAKNRKKGG